MLEAGSSNRKCNAKVAPIRQAQGKLVNQPRTVRYGAERKRQNSRRGRPLNFGRLELVPLVCFE